VSRNGAGSTFSAYRGGVPAGRAAPENDERAADAATRSLCRMIAVSFFEGPRGEKNYFFFLLFAIFFTIFFLAAIIKRHPLPY
jgi:hypothetical protein